jgi:hypothetical protein
MKEETMEKFTPVIDGVHPAGMGGIQKIYRFKNGYGASVVQTSWTYGGSEGKYELAVVWFMEQNDNREFELIYDTPITCDVIGHLMLADVEKLLRKIHKLPIRSRELIAAKKKEDAKRKRRMEEIIKECRSKCETKGE